MKYANQKLVLYEYFALGDALIVTAALKSLAEANNQITIICPLYSAEIFRRNPYVHEVVPLDDYLNNIEARAEYYRQQGYTVVSLETVPNGPYHQTHAVCQFLGVDANDLLNIFLSEEETRWGEQFKGKILLHNTGQWTPYKNWPNESSRELATKLKQHYNLELVQLLGPRDIPTPGVSYIHAPSIWHAAAAVRSSLAVVAIDSLINHFTRALNKRSIILWSSSEPSRWGYPQNINLVNGVVWDFSARTDSPLLHCQPCYRGSASNPLQHVKNYCINTVPCSEKYLPDWLHEEAVAPACCSSNHPDLVLRYLIRLLTTGE